MAQECDTSWYEGVWMTRVKFVSREKYIIFLKRAEQYRNAMKTSYEHGDYDATVGSAVHCTISVIDAISVLVLGKKSSAQNHNEIVILLNEIKTTDESEKSRVRGFVVQIISMKTLAEYEDNNMSKANAEKTMHLCEKVYVFIDGEIQKKKMI